jgi:hypothetical protein
MFRFRTEKRPGTELSALLMNSIDTPSCCSDAQGHLTLSRKSLLKSSASARYCIVCFLEREARKTGQLPVVRRLNEHYEFASSMWRLRS